MNERIDSYFVSLGLSYQEARDIHRRLSSDYGLSVRGAAEHFGIDPLDFDSKCDAALPLEKLLHPNTATRSLLEEIDGTRFRLWALTNAYKTHANRVMKILELDDLFEGCVSCQYDQPNFPCKPEDEYYHTATKQVGLSDYSKILFIDDKLDNVQAAKKLGWGSCVWLQESVEGVAAVVQSNQGIPYVDAVVSDLLQLRKVWPWIFRGKGKAVITDFDMEAGI